MEIRLTGTSGMYSTSLRRIVEVILVLVSMTRNSTVPMPCTFAYFPFATLIRLNGTLYDNVVNTLRSLVQLEVAPESKIHCESPGTPLSPKMSL